MWRASVASELSPINKMQQFRSAGSRRGTRLGTIDLCPGALIEPPIRLPYTSQAPHFRPDGKLDGGIIYRNRISSAPLEFCLRLCLIGEQAAWWRRTAQSLGSRASGALSIHPKAAWLSKLSLHPARATPASEPPPPPPTVSTERPPVPNETGTRLATTKFEPLFMGQ